MVLRAAPLFLPTRGLGWDIALAPSGPVAPRGEHPLGPPAPPHDAPGLRARRRPGGSPVMERAATAARQARSLVNVTRTGARVYGTSPFSVAVRARRLRIRQGFEYEEALSEGLLDPSLSDAERALHASRHATVEAQRHLNPEATNQLTGDKAIFYGYCAAIGLPIPELYGVVDVRGGSGGATPGAWSPARPGSRTSSHTTCPTSRWSSPPTATTARACASCAAAGPASRPPRRPRLCSRCCARTPSSRSTCSRSGCSTTRVGAELAGDAPHTVRIVTLLSREGECEVLYAVIGLGLGGGDTDNFRAGRNGNGLAPVDLATGALGPPSWGAPTDVDSSMCPRRPPPASASRASACPIGARPSTGARRSPELRPRPHPRVGRGADPPRARDRGGERAFGWPRSGPEQGRLLERLRSA